MIRILGINSSPRIRESHAGENPAHSMMKLIRLAKRGSIGESARLFALDNL